MDGTFLVEERIKLFPNGLKANPSAGPFLLIQHLEIQARLILGGPPTTRLFRGINRLARRGVLKSLTLKAGAPISTSPRSRFPWRLERSKTHLLLAVEQLGDLTSRFLTVCVHLRKSLVVDSSLARWMIFGFSPFQNLNAAVRHLYAAFGGGEMWFQDPVHFDRVLLWNDYLQVTRVDRDAQGAGVVRTPYTKGVFLWDL